MSASRKALISLRMAFMSCAESPEISKLEMKKKGWGRVGWGGAGGGRIILRKYLAAGCTLIQIPLADLSRDLSFVSSQNWFSFRHLQ